MSVVDDIRKLLQDVVAPEIKALDARITALDKRLDGLDKKVDGLDRKIDLHFDLGSEKLELTRDLILAEMRANRASLETSMAKLTHELDLERRISKIESERTPDRTDAPTQRIA